MELISKDKEKKISYYKLTIDEITMYRYMETHPSDSGVQIETELTDNVMMVVGGFFIQLVVLRYFEDLGKSSEYIRWLRKHKLNDICLKLVK